MNTDFVNLTAENLANEHLCCIIRSKKPHQGVEAKRQWLSDRLEEGHIFRKLNEKATVFIEYAPCETAWVPIIADNYYYIYCLWVSGSHKGKGYGKLLMEYCLSDAKEKGKSGICMLGARKQKAWLSDQAFAKKFGFTVVDTTSNGDVTAFQIVRMDYRACLRWKCGNGLFQHIVKLFQINAFLNFLYPVGRVCDRFKQSEVIIFPYGCVKAYRQVQRVLLLCAISGSFCKCSL